MRPKTLLELAGVTPTPPSLGEATVVVIDAQREYVDGALPLVGVKSALTEIGRLLDHARHLGSPIVHVKHRGREGGAFGPGSRGYEIADEASPTEKETVIEKSLSNAFAGTDLKARLDAIGRKDVVIVGFMTHMCVEATARFCARSWLQGDRRRDSDGNARSARPDRRRRNHRRGSAAQRACRTVGSVRDRRRRCAGANAEVIPRNDQDLLKASLSPLPHGERERAAVAAFQQFK